MYLEELWQAGNILKQSFSEQKIALADIYACAEKILVSPFDTPQEFRVSLGKTPPEFFYLRKNIFSLLFQSVYQLLGISKERRLLYARLNQLFRIWVTSADNLLDGEDKIAVPIEMPGSARISRQFISIMLADRIMQHIFAQAVEKGILSAQESQILSDKSLQTLLPSAAEEASERERESPGYRMRHRDIDFYHCQTIAQRFFSCRPGRRAEDAGKSAKKGARI